MYKGFTFRAYAGLLLLILAAGYWSSSAFMEEVSVWRYDAPPDSMSRYVARFAPVKEWVPPGRVVQYIPPSTENRATFWFHYAATQYALAPLVIDSLPVHPWVVADFSPNDSLYINQLVNADSLTVVKAFDSGIVLLQRRLP